MAGDYAKNFATGVVNPKKNLQRREKEAGLDDDSAPDPKKGIDKGDLPGSFQMSQGQFSGYPQTKTAKGGPPADMLKKRDKE